MPHILSGILSLIQYKNEVEGSFDEKYRPQRCECCGRLRLRRHGTYPRGSDRINTSCHSLNPILIQRYYCPSCRKTMSVLPECISPRRWYLWEFQQTALLLVLLGKSVCKVASELIPSRHTIARWCRWFKEQYHLHRDALCTHYHALTGAVGFNRFWKGCLNFMPLSSAMRLCQVTGVSIP